jgi:hypothetical protein
MSLPTGVRVSLLLQPMLTKRTAIGAIRIGSLLLVLGKDVGAVRARSAARHHIHPAGGVGAELSRQVKKERSVSMQAVVGWSFPVERWT